MNGSLFRKGVNGLISFVAKSCNEQLRASTMTMGCSRASRPGMGFSINSHCGSSAADNHVSETDGS